MDEAPNRRHYEEHRRRAAGRQSTLSQEGRDIGQLPPVADPARRAAAEQSFRVFCETYFAAAFCKAWSPDHLKVIGKIEQAVLNGAQFANAMPRGSGKTTLAIAAVLWALLIGARRFVVIIAATGIKGKDLLAACKTALECNELLAADFPEVCFPIHRLDRIHNRCRGQTHLGQPTRMEWSAKKLVLPTIAGSRASGAVLTCTGLDSGQIRGQLHALDDGTMLRPDLVIIDDPQTRKTAKSSLKDDSKEKLLAGDVLGMAGPGVRIAAICCVTVIFPGDMADRILDPKIHPEWHGDRCKLLYALPAREDLWEQYFEIRRGDQAAGGDGAAATTFYAGQRAAMDSGAVVGWEQRFGDGELSALQHAMNLLCDRGKATFLAEYQNTPEAEDTGADRLQAVVIAVKTNGLPRGTVPADATLLTAFIDVHKELLYFVVCGWTEGYTGAVLDYGTWPDQRRAYFQLRDATRTMQRAFAESGQAGARSAGMEGWIRYSLETLVGQLAAREYRTAAGLPHRIARIGIDANWGPTSVLVKRFCWESTHKRLLLPSHGRFYRASGRGFDFKAKEGEQVGQGMPWRIPPPAPGQGRHITWDANWFKSFVALRWSTALGERGALSLFAGDHRMFADHTAAEKPERVIGPERTVDEWYLPPDKPDNHLWDCTVGATVMAAREKLRLPELSATPKPKPRRMSAAEWKARKRR